MDISTEGATPLQFSAPQGVEAASFPVQNEPGSSSRLLHHKVSPILKVYSEHQLKEGAETAFAYLLIALNEEEVEELLQSDEAEFKQQLLSHMPDLLDCDPGLMKAMKDRPYSLPINFNQLRRLHNDQLITYYQKHNNQQQLSIALYRALALNLQKPENRDILRGLLSDQRSLGDLPVEHLLGEYGSAKLTTCLRDGSGAIRLEPKILFHQLGLISTRKSFSPDCMEPEGKAKALLRAMDIRMIELGFEEDSLSAEPEAFFTRKLTEIDNAEDLLLLIVWGQRNCISNSALTCCDQKLASVMCSDLLLHADQPATFIEAKVLLSKYSQDMSNPNLTNEDKLRLQTQLEQSGVIQSLRKEINKVIQANTIDNTVKAYPYSGFARCYRALRHFGVSNRPASLQRMMLSLPACDLLEQYVSSHSLESLNQTAEEYQHEVDAYSNCSKLAPNVKIESMEGRARKKMLERITHCYLNDLPMPWAKEEQATKQEPPSRISAESFVSSVELEADDVFSDSPNF